jgi:hypothetical protein
MRRSILALLAATSMGSGAAQAQVVAETAKQMAPTKLRFGILVLSRMGQKADGVVVEP